MRKNRTEAGKKGRQLRVMQIPPNRIFNKKCFGARVWKVTGVYFGKIGQIT